MTPGPSESDITGNLKMMMIRLGVGIQVARADNFILKLNLNATGMPVMFGDYYYLLLVLTGRVPYYY